MDSGFRSEGPNCVVPVPGKVGSIGSERRSWRSENLWDGTGFGEPLVVELKGTLRGPVRLLRHRIDLTEPKTLGHVLVPKGNSVSYFLMPT